MKHTKAKFKKGDWIRAVSGPHKGKSITVGDVAKMTFGYVYFGWFCGDVIMLEENDVTDY
jgi:hypothetical protein